MKHLTTELQQQIEWRKSQVLELSSQGYTEREIASRLQVHCTTVHRDIASLNKQARENLQKHINETIPAEYQKACHTIDMVLRMTWSIISKTEDEKTRLQALTLIDDVNQHRVELATNGVIVNDALRIIQSKMEQLNGNGKGKEKRLLQDIKEDFNSLPEAEEGEQLPTTNGVF
jgi:transcriptional regulator